MTTLTRTRPTTRGALILALAVALLVTLMSPSATLAAEIDPPTSTDSVLVVAPHPGDETVMAAGISYALPSYAGGAGVTIAYMTNNDFGVAGGDLGPLQLEAVTAQTTHLNRVEDDLIFLGYPDGELALVWGTAAPAAHMATTTGLSATYASRGLGSTDWYDYRMGEPADEHAPYNQEAMIADMEALIDDRRPDHIFTGDPNNLNTDYQTTYQVVATALDNVIAANPGYGAVLHTTVVWHPDAGLHGTWPQDRDAAADILQDTAVDPTASPTLDDVGLLWADREQFVVPVALQNPVDGANPKAQAIDAYVSQGGLGGLIGRFVHRDEIFWAEYLNYPEVSVGAASATEGDDVEFTLTRTGALNVAFSVTATTSDATASAGTDYTATAEAIDFAVGAATATFTVPTTSDDVDEGDETFTVTLSAPTNNATLAADPTGTGTITDDDTAGVTLDEGGGVALTEGGAADTYTVVLDSEPTADVVITLTPDAQVTVDPTSLTFTTANWDTAQTVSVSGVSDGLVETDPHPGVVAHSSASTDGNYDGISVDDVTADVSDATALDLVVTVDGLSAGSTGLPTADFTATVAAGGNGTVTFAWTAVFDGATVATDTGATFSFTPTEGGLYTVTVIPTDDDGAHDPVAVEINVLTDIENNLFVGDIIWLADRGITKGCNPDDGNTMFCPNDYVTRGQMAAFLVRFLGLTDDGGGNTFIDDDGSIFEHSIAKLAAAGITKGCNPADGNTMFCPDDYVTRGQMAAFLRRADALP